MHRVSLLLFALLLTACDSGGGTDRSNIVGTWGLTASGSVVEVTSPTTQAYIALNRTAVSTVEGDGAVSVRLPFARRTDSNNTFDRYHFTSFDPNGPVPDEAYERLIVTQRLDRYSADLILYDPETGFDTYSNSGFRTVLTLSNAVLTLDLIGVTRGPDLVQIGGFATFPSTSLSAGVPTRIETDRTLFEVGPLGVPAVRYTFEADGDWRGERDISTSQTDVDLGTWDAQDGRVRIEVPRGDSEAEVTRFDFETQADTLSLSAVRDVCETTACLVTRTSELGLDGTLTAYRSLQALDFVETEAPFVRTPAPGETAQR